MDELPPELIDRILHYLDDREYWYCQKASKLFQVSSKSEWRERRFLDSSFYEVLYNGNVEGIRYHLDVGSSLILEMHIDKRLYEAIKHITADYDLIAAITAYRGHIHVLCELIRRQFTLSNDLAVFATRGGKLEFLKYLHFIGYKGSGIGYYLNHYNFRKAIKWHRTIHNKNKVKGINMSDYYDFSIGNYLDKDYIGQVYRW